MASPQSPQKTSVGPHVHTISNVAPSLESAKDTDNAPCSSLTFDHQSSLPPLPIPSLEETLRKFPTVVQALQTPEQHQATVEACEAFLHGPGPALQKALRDYATAGETSGTHGSYIEEFWNESYLAPNASVVLNLNPYFVLEASPDPKKNSGLFRAANLGFAAIQFASMLRHEQLAPDCLRRKTKKANNSNTPANNSAASDKNRAPEAKEQSESQKKDQQFLCMDQFRVLFGASRQPTDDACDSVAVYNDSAHVVVLCRNQMYYFPALWPDTGHVAVDEGDVYDILQAIDVHAAQQQESNHAHGLGVLTSLPRSEWARVRTELCRENPQNEAAFHLVDSALFVLVLDDFVPANDHQLAGNMLHGTHVLAEDDDDDAHCGRNGHPQQVGTCLNRWYDKLQLIVCRDGSAGVNFEHSAIDGHTALRFVSDIFAETVIAFAESITALIHGQGHIPHVVQATVERAATANASGRTLDVLPKKIVFQLNDSVVEKIRYAEAALGDEIYSADTRVLQFEEFGKLLIVANKLSPDSTVQMSMHLAYYELYGKFVCGYEPVLTKSFYHGRTEAVRSATPQALELCRVWTNPDSTPDDILQALRVATREHSRLVKESAQGKGVDRHLFALKSIAQRQGMPVPDFFSSQGWQCLNHTVLSTSNCGNPALRMFGFGPVVADGFGLGYIIKDHGITYSIASKHRQTARYARTLEGVLRKIKGILQPLSEVKVEHCRPALKEVRRTSPRATTAATAAYEDIYGESIAQLPEPKNNSRRQSSRAGHLFKTVSERSMSAKLLDLADIRIDLDLDGKERKEPAEASQM